jgi:hypothetical protein
MYSTKELIQKSIRRDLLNELFSETLAELPQATIKISESDNIDIDTLVQQLSENDILITNNQYNVSKSDFMVLDNRGDIILDVSTNGDRINNASFDYFLEESALDKLIKIYDKLKRSGCVYTLALA